MRLSRVGLLSSVFTLVHAVPYLIPRAETPVSASQLADLAPYTQFARAAYCSTSSLSSWGCGRTSCTFKAPIVLFDLHVYRGMCCSIWIPTYTSRRRWQCCANLYVSSNPDSMYSDTVEKSFRGLLARQELRRGRA